MNLFLEAMKEGLRSGDTLELRDFGFFRIRSRAQSKARNPKTGEKVAVGARKTVYFKQSRPLKGRIL